MNQFSHEVFMSVFGVFVWMLAGLLALIAFSVLAAGVSAIGNVQPITAAFTVAAFLGLVVGPRITVALVISKGWVRRNRAKIEARLAEIDAEGGHA